MKATIFLLGLCLNAFLVTAQEIEQSRLLAGGYQSQSLERAGTILTAANKIASKTQVEYNAGQAIVLQPGFEARAGSVFLARVLPVVSLASENNEPGLSVRAYPNPFVEQTTIRYTLPIKGQVRHTLLDAKGQPMPQANKSAEQAAGTYQTQLEGHDLPVGVYLYQLQVDGQTRTMRLIKK